MRYLFIQAKSKARVNVQKILKASKNLPTNIAIAYSIQFYDMAKEIKNLLCRSHKITALIQVLGCSKPRFPDHTSAVLLIGSGKFHAVSLAFETKLPIYVLNKHTFEKIAEKDINSLEKKHKASYLRFLNANNVGILISLKPGQQRLSQALNLRNKIKDKKTYLFLSNNINSSEFENYGLDSWVNTACPRLDMDSFVISEGDLNIRN